MKNPENSVSVRTYLAVTSVVAFGAPATLFACSGAGQALIQSTCDACSEPETGASTDTGGSHLDAPFVDAPNDAGPPRDDAGCPAGHGPRMMKLPAPDGGFYCIDSTEVTNAQYAEFLDAASSLLTQQSPECVSNTSFNVDVPGTVFTPQHCGYDPVALADHPVACVTWCDARAFCAWTGKALCARGGGAYPNVGDQWINACSSAGQYQSMYAQMPALGECVDNSYDASRPVKSLHTCQPADPRYAGIFDMLGNVREWVDECSSVDGGTQCLFVGGSFYDVPIDCTVWASASTIDPVPVTTRSPGVGFRCCAQP